VKWLTPLPLWTGILAGPTAWAIDHTISYAIVKWTCSTQREVVLHAITPAALAIVAVGTAAAFLAVRDSSGDGPTDGGRQRQRARFMAILGLVSCAFFALAIVADEIPRWVLDACR
jgi:hypothetical protein